MTSSSAGRPTCELLVSVRNAVEAELVLEHGVGWIDLKDPSQGALGAAAPQTAIEVAETLRSHPRKSAALGELIYMNYEQAAVLAALFPILKLGLSNIQGNSQHENTWQDGLHRVNDLLAAARSRLVPVIYADWQHCRAISPEAVIRCAIELQAPYVLIDTYFKTGRSLLDHLTAEQLLAWSETLQKHTCQLVLAGSLRLEHVPLLWDLPAAAIGVRGAVCDAGRDADINPKKLAEWISLLKRSTDACHRNLLNSENAGVLLR